MPTVQFQHETSIDAPIEATWNLLEQIEDWPSFVPTVTSVERLDEGPLVVNSQARLRQPGLRPATWTITRLEPPNVFEWNTRLLGLAMTARHELERHADGCRQRLILAIDGPGATLAGRLARKLVDRSLSAENAGFKSRVEG